MKKQEKKGKIREFKTGATRDTDEGKLDYEGFLSPIVMDRYQKFINIERMRAWCAGLFEGEGCITFSKVYGRKKKDGTYTYPNGRNYPRLSMSLTDEDTLRKFQCFMGGTMSGPRKIVNRKLIWWWSAQGEEARNITRIILPYLGLRRSMRLAEVFGVKQMAISAGFELLVLERYSEYMNKHRKQSDGGLRDSDNWQRGIPKEQYMKSLWRHFMDVWLEHRGYESRDGMEEALMGLLFNTMGYTYELLKERQYGKKKKS